MSLAVATLITSLLSMPTGGPKPEHNEFVQLFAATCMANTFSPDKLRNTLNSELTPELPPERATPLLRGNSGTAWEVFFGKGQYAVALTQSGVCAVFARHAEISEVQEGFIRFVSSAPEPMVSRKIDSLHAGPNSEDLTTTAYAWSRPGERLEIVFTLTTSKIARDPEIQAMASVALSQSEP